MNRRRAVVAGAAGVVVLAAAITVTARSSGSAPPDAPASGGPPVASAQITMTTLTETATVSGELGYGAAEPAESKAGGTLTWLPGPGTVLTRGDVLLRADDKPVVLLYGRLPMYRPLTPGTKGSDVAQFETNLKALGYRGFPVGDTYTEATAAAVKRWQKHLGLDETGNVDIAAVLYVPAEIRVATWSARIGAGAGGQVLTYTADIRVVTVTAPAANVTWAVPGTAVSVTLPAGATVSGSVAAVGTEASSPTVQDGANGAQDGSSANATVPVTVSIADQAALGTLDKAPVDVRYTVQQRANVLAVPVTALLAPLGGGYALEIVEGTASRIVPVETGLFADGLVEVRGAGIAAGMTVRVPA
jgi:hypothetical protein